MTSIVNARIVVEVRGCQSDLVFLFLVSPAMADILAAQYQTLMALAARVQHAHAAADQMREDFIRLRGVRHTNGFACVLFRFVGVLILERA